MRGISSFRCCWSLFALKNCKVISFLPLEVPGASYSSYSRFDNFIWYTLSKRCLSTTGLRVLNDVPLTYEGDLSRNIPKRSLRKRHPLTAVYDQNPTVAPQIVSVALAESFDLVSIFRDVRLSSFYLATCVDEESDEGLHFVPKKEYILDPNAVHEFFVYEDGVVVFWGIEEHERGSILLLLGDHAVAPYAPSLVEEETDSMPFTVVAGNKTRVSKNHFYLDVSKHDGGFKSNCSILERYAFSHGMAASVKIGIWESQLSDQAEPLALTTKALAKGVILWKRKEALRKTGQFAELRHSINLNCGLLDTDFYWERDNLENFYYMAAHHFSVSKRLKLLNSRLDYCEELVKIVDGMLSHRHASTLEWMIIVLIVIEVFCDIWHFVESLNNRNAGCSFKDEPVKPTKLEAN